VAYKIIPAKVFPECDRLIDRPALFNEPQIGRNAKALPILIWVKPPVRRSGAFAPGGWSLKRHGIAAWLTGMLQVHSSVGSPATVSRQKHPFTRSASAALTKSSCRC